MPSVDLGGPPIPWLDAANESNLQIHLGYLDEFWLLTCLQQIGGTSLSGFWAAVGFTGNTTELPQICLGLLCGSLALKTKRYVYPIYPHGWLFSECLQHDASYSASWGFRRACASNCRGLSSLSLVQTFILQYFLCGHHLPPCRNLAQLDREATSVSTTRRKPCRLWRT